MSRWRQSVAASLVLVAVFTAVSGAADDEAVKKLAEVVAKIEAGEYAPDEFGVVTLPPKVAKAVGLHECYITGKAAAPNYVLLPVSRGKGANLQGYLYSPKAALKVGQEVLVLTPIPRVDVTTAENEVTVDSVLSPAWYSVSRTLD